MKTLHELKPPFHLMSDDTALGFVRQLRADRKRRKIRPAEKKARAKKQDKLATKLAALPEHEFELAMQKLRGQ